MAPKRPQQIAHLKATERLAQLVVERKRAFARQGWGGINAILDDPIGLIYKHTPDRHVIIDFRDLTLLWVGKTWTGAQRARVQHRRDADTTTYQRLYAAALTKQQRRLANTALRALPATPKEITSGPPAE